MERTNYIGISSRSLELHEQGTCHNWKDQKEMNSEAEVNKPKTSFGAHI